MVPHRFNTFEASNWLVRSSRRDGTYCTVHCRMRTCRSCTPNIAVRSSLSASSARFHWKQNMNKNNASQWVCVPLNVSTWGGLPRRWSGQLQLHQMHHGISHMVAYSQKRWDRVPLAQETWVTLVTCVGDQWRPVQTCSFGTPLEVTSGGSHWNWSNFGFQAGGTHPIGMLSCLFCYVKFLSERFYRFNNVQG